MKYLFRLIISICIIVIGVVIYFSTHIIDEDTVQISRPQDSIDFTREEIVIDYNSEARIEGDFSISSILQMATSEALAITKYGDYIELASALGDLHKYTADKEMSITVPAGAGKVEFDLYGTEYGYYEWKKTYEYKFSDYVNTEVGFILFMGDSIWVLYAEEKNNGTLKGSMEVGRQ